MISNSWTVTSSFSLCRMPSHVSTMISSMLYLATARNRNDIATTAVLAKSWIISECECYGHVTPALTGHGIQPPLRRIALLSPPASTLLLIGAAGVGWVFVTDGTFESLPAVRERLECTAGGEDSVVESTVIDTSCMILSVWNRVERDVTRRSG